MAPLLCAQTCESLKLLPGLLLLGGWGTPRRSQRGKCTHRPGPCPVLGEQGGVADPRRTWRLCWMPPTTGQPVWVLDALPLDGLPTDSAETQAHTGLSRWCKTSVYSDFFPRCPGPLGCVLLSGHGGAPTAPGSLGRTRHRGDTNWGGELSQHQEGGAAGHSQGCRDP